MAKEQKTRYKLVKQIGAGDFAKVFAADDVKLGRKVAIKQIHGQYMDDDLFAKINDDYFASMEDSSSWLTQSIGAYRAQRDRVRG